MPIDSNIPLSFKPTTRMMSPADAISLKQVAQKMQMGEMEMQEMRRKQQEAQEIRQIASRPGAMDQHGMFTPTALSEIAARNPMTAAQIQQQQNQRIAQQAQQQLTRLNVTSKQNDLIEESLTGVYADYQRTKERNGPEAAAAQFKTTWGQRIEDMAKSGQFTPEQIESVRRVQSPDMVEGVIGGSRAYREWVNTREREKGGALSEERAKRDEERLRLQQERGDREAKRLDLAVSRLERSGSGGGGDSDKAPKMRTRFDGEQAVQEEWDPKTRTWKEIGRGARFGRKDEDVNFRRLKAFGDAIDKADIPVSRAMLDEIKPLVADPEVLKHLTGPRSYIPDPLVADKVNQGRQALQRLLNVELKDRSGAAVVQQEYDRFKKEYAIGLLKTPQQVKDAVERFERIMEKYYAAVAARYPKETRDAYFSEMKQVQPYGESVGSEKPKGKPAPSQLRIAADRIVGGG